MNTQNITSNTILQMNTYWIMTHRFDSLHCVHTGYLVVEQSQMDSDKTCFDYLTVVYIIYVLPIHLNLIQPHICVHVRTLERCLTLYSCVDVKNAGLKIDLRNLIWQSTPL